MGSNLDRTAMNREPGSGPKFSIRRSQTSHAKRFYVDSDVDSDADSGTPRIDAKPESARIGVLPPEEEQPRIAIRIDGLQRHTSGRKMLD